jgi:hypothetical protein
MNGAASSSPSAKTALPETFRLFNAIVILVVLTGASLLCVPHATGAVWPWIAPEFNLRFIGSAYLPGLVSLAILLICNRWSPGRLVIGMGLAFSIVALLVSAIYPDRFDPSRAGVWAWFVVYILSSLVFVFVLWRFRRIHASSPPVEPGWRAFYLAQSVGFLLLGFALFVFPEAATVGLALSGR